MTLHFQPFGVCFSESIIFSQGRPVTRTAYELLHLRVGFGSSCLRFRRYILRSAREPLFHSISYSPCFSFPSVFPLSLFPLFTISPRDGYQQARPGTSPKSSLPEPRKMHLHPRTPCKIPKIRPELSTLSVNKTVDWGFF